MKRFAITLTACLISICAAAQGVLSVESESAVLDNGNVEILITVNLEPQWYIYSTEPVKGGPMATSLTAADNGPYTLEGTLRDTETPHTKIDPGFQMEVKYFENSVRFAQTLRPSTTEKFTFKGWLEFQTCNGMECLLNEEEISVDINPSAAPAAAETVTAAAESGPTDTGRGFWGFLLIAFLAGLAGAGASCS